MNLHQAGGSNIKCWLHNDDQHPARLSEAEDVFWQIRSGPSIEIDFDWQFSSVSPSRTSSSMVLAGSEREVRGGRGLRMFNSSIIACSGSDCRLLVNELNEPEPVLELAGQGWPVAGRDSTSPDLQI